MHTRVTAALTLTLTAAAVVGCAKTPKDRLQGRWLGESVENISAAQVDRVTGWVKGTAIEFSGSKATVTIPAESPRTGMFKVSRVQGERVMVSFLRPEGGSDEAEFRFAGDQTLRWNIGNGREIVLQKEKN